MSSEAEDWNIEMSTFAFSCVPEQLWTLLSVRVSPWKQLFWALIISIPDSSLQNPSNFQVCSSVWFSRKSRKKWIENKWNWAFFCFVIVISRIIIIVIICFHWQTQRPPLYSVLTQLFALICFFNPKIKNSFAVLGRQTG